MSEKQTGLAEVFPVGTKLLLKDKELDISPLRLGEIPRVLKCLSEFMDDEVLSPDSYGKFLTTSAESVLEVMCIAARCDREWLDDLDLEEGTILFEKIIEVNADFFVKRVLPRLQSVTQRFTITTTGQNLSSVFPEPASHLQKVQRSQSGRPKS